MTLNFCVHSISSLDLLYTKLDYFYYNVIIIILVSFFISTNIVLSKNRRDNQLYVTTLPKSDNNYSRLIKEPTANH